ncbi:hypothetical protein AYO45_01505 [Gammaproteobacteria bacterium SCGC AG-212-F23]|nr:hypothetical protein AYO45_01505 [Gammaproteobacteria bacterium SCGC AG-212-F23]
MIPDLVITKNSLHQIATYATHLANGLQNAAPLQQQEKPANSILYLLEIADYIQKEITAIDTHNA